MGRGEVGKMDAKDEEDVGEEEREEAYKIEVSSGSVSSGIPSPIDAPRGRLFTPTAELKKPIIVSVFGEGGLD